MVIINDDICGVATWDFYELDPVVCSIYEEHQRTISAFSVLLAKLKQFELFIPKKIITSDWGYDLEELTQRSIKSPKNNEKFNGKIITHPQKIFSLSEETICDEKFWWNIFEEWSGKKKAINLYFTVFGKTLIYADQKRQWVDGAFVLGYLSVKTFATDWMPYLLDGITPNPDYEANFFRLRDAFTLFMQETGYTVAAEHSKFATVKGINVLNLTDDDGIRIPMNEDGSWIY